jgi:hypothetical protein
MIVAHIAGLMFEEWLNPFLATSGSMAIGLGAAFRHFRKYS